MGILYRFILVTIATQLSFADSPLPSRYHTYSDIDSILHNWDNEFGDSINVNSPYGESSGPIYKLIEIGVSTEDELPFWAVKLSFNANQHQDKPRVLILGQCHAEEILGVEISMELIYRFLHPEEYPTEYQTLAGLLYSSEIWIVPTYNPEGLHVVHGWEESGVWVQDLSYRKNKRDANQNGAFDFDTNGYGNDIDGVDLNRNYSLNWIFGDEYLETDEGCGSNPSYVSNYDYYRGESPFSENEVVAIRDLLLEHDFLLSIAYHSSRSGCVAERVIYPWLWTGPKISPDYQVIQPLGQQIAELTLSEVGDGNYHFAASGSMRGNAHDWTYATTGCIQYLIEVGTDNIQPTDVDLIENTIDRNLPGAFYLMKRAAGINYPTGPDIYQVTGIISDESSGIPIEGVEVVVHEMDGGILEPRKTNEFGRFRRLLYLDSFDLIFTKFGYHDYFVSNLTPSADIISELNIQMVPKTQYNLVLSLDLPETHSSTVSLILESYNNKFEYNLYEGDNLFSLPEGEYNITILSDDILPHLEVITMNDNVEKNIELQWYDLVFNDDFDNLENWEIVMGDWVSNDGKLLSQQDLIYSNFSPPGPIRINSSDYIFNNSNSQDSSDINFVINLNMKYEVEWDRDTLYFDAFSSADSIRLFSFYNHNWTEEHYFATLPAYENYKLSMGIVSDITIGYRGLSLDNIKVMKTPLNDCLKGDINHNGEIAIDDIIILISILLDNVGASGFQECSGDRNLDGNIDVMDIVSIVAFILGE